MSHRCLSVIVIGMIMILTACTSQDGAEPTEESTKSGTSSPNKQSTGTASDSGEAEIGDVEYSVLGNTEGNTDVAFAVEVTNTSDTDLLHVVELALTWKGKGSKTENWADENILNVEPGESAILGRVSTVDGFTPTDLKAEVIADDWYPMKNVEKLDYNFKVEVTESTVKIGDDVTRATVEYRTSGNVERLGYLYARLLMRDAEGNLLGASEAADSIAPNREGQHSVNLEFNKGDWISEADASKTEVVLEWGCCVLFR